MRLPRQVVSKRRGGKVDEDRGAPRLYLLDGTSQLFRAFFAIRGLTSPEGLPTNAVYGFATILKKLLQEERPRFLAVAFDLPGPTFRHDRYSDYKANRPPAPEDLNVQVPFAKELCRAMRIPVLEEPGYEADDLIATFARLGRQAGFDVVVVASDKDLLQLVGEGVELLNPSKGLRLDEAGVAETFGVPPRFVRDVLGLMGDAVDNIPGVPGVGEKTAIALVARYGSLEAILERAGAVVACFEARDRLLGFLSGDAHVSDIREAAADLARRIAALLEEGADPEHLERLKGAAEVASRARANDLAARDVRAAAKVLRELDRGSQRRAWQSIFDHADQARLSRDLATLDADAPIRFDPERLALGEPDAEVLAALFRRLGFRSLVSDLTPPSAPEAKAPEFEPAPRARYIAVMGAEVLHALAGACRRSGSFAVDTETDSVDPMRARLVGISIAHREGEGFYIPLGHTYLGAPAQLPLELVRDVLGPVLADPRVGKFGQNLKYDLHVLRRHGLLVAGWWLDTMVAAFLLDSDRASFGLDALAWDLLGHKTIRYSELAGSGARQKTLDQVEIDRVTDYAAEDAEVTWRLAALLAPRLAEEGLLELYETMDGPLLPLLARMEAHGIRVDAEVLREMSSRITRVLDGLRQEIVALAGTSFNVDSPKQLREVLFERLGLTPRRKTAKSGVHSTDAETLEDLAQDHPIARKVLEYRELAKLRGTYVDALPQMIHPATGRVHTSYHPTGAATGRLSSSDPNLQNIPARTETGLMIRRAFVPDPGHIFLACDYSQVELRVLAHLSADPELIEAFRAGEDIHRRTAASVFGVPPESVDDTMRRRAKAVNFGILYGMSEARLAREQGMSRGDAGRFIEAYFARFKKVKAYIEGVRSQATHDACVRTLFGRVRRFPALRAGGGRAVLEQTLRAAVNTTIQGTAADLMKLAMLRVDEALSRAGLAARMLLQVHDELLLEVPEGELDATATVVSREMQSVHPLQVPLVVDVKRGRSWMEVT